jgi:LysM repeat protein
VNCYTCDQTATNACKRCAKPYCEDHGNSTYCASCLQPASAMPSFNLYRGALLVMLVGTALAVFLIVRPPGESGDAAPVVVNNARPTASTSGGQATIAPQTPDSAQAGTRTPGTPPQDATPGAAGTGTPATSETPTPRTPAATATNSPFGEYIVKSGDTLYDIAQATISPGDDIDAYARAIAALNSINFDNPDLPIGKKLLLPKLPQ